MRTDSLLLIPALLVAIYQIKLWKSLRGNDIAVISGKYELQHFLAFIFAKYSTYLIFTYQLFFNFLKITNNNVVYLYVVGYLFVVSGLILAISAVKKLENNWDNMMLYKIIPNHQLIKNGVYKHIRHPIYTAIIFEVVGYQLIANSWLVIFFLITSSIVLIRHIKNEEELLETYFGKEYTNYKKSTKKLIPFIY